MLASYDRPVKTDPFFYADKKDALIGEFENYLKILKSVRSIVFGVWFICERPLCSCCDGQHGDLQYACNFACYVLFTPLP
jgi:hypothetical protein